MGLRIGRTPDGRRLEVDRVVAADVDAAWELLVDTERWPEWGPSVRAVDYDGESNDGGVIGPDASGRVRVGAVWVPFRVETFEDGTGDVHGSGGRERRRWTWRVAGVPATGHRVESLPDGRCRIVFEVPLVAAPYAAVCERALSRIESLLTTADGRGNP
ncbi:SRPBCC family protein [Halobium salinum]|uniref:SRPBCC family protein n=1 Tax=Halobium salinum TaxID=1364940 RepID=A0ABD5P6D8_9EURY|nr:SRPBCC family protein [Halobium salinum]